MPPVVSLKNSHIGVWHHPVSMLSGTAPNRDDAVHSDIAVLLQSVPLICACTCSYFTEQRSVTIIRKLVESEQSPCALIQNVDCCIVLHGWVYLPSYSILLLFMDHLATVSEIERCNNGVYSWFRIQCDNCNKNVKAV